MVAGIRARLVAALLVVVSPLSFGRWFGVVPQVWVSLVHTWIQTRSVNIAYCSPARSDTICPSQYGAPNNAGRPGGITVVADFQSNVSTTVFRIVADNSSVTSLISDIRNNCSSHLSSSSSTTPSPFNKSDSGTPKPEQVVQYYRASSVALTLDGYNNTATYAPEGTPDTPLPTFIDTTLLDCLNQTIGLAVPLIDGAGSRWATPNMGLVGLAWVLWCLSSFI
jgi:hypothetical protein